MRADARENRQALIGAARRMLAERGADVSMRSVAAAAGVGIGTLYRHFPTRDDLLTAVVGSMVDDITRVIESHETGWASPEDAEATWRSCAHELAGLRLAAIGENVIVLAPQEGEVWKATAPLRGRLTDAYSGLLTRAADAGLVDAALAPWRFHLGLAAIARPLPGGFEARFDDLAPGQSTWLVDTFLNGLRP
ncbi:TetR/AcrR family transcriptional regulator [Tomitella gaofuii]|uniref:TetR/AcrR family transcriptional regulator n=1 Tax=Tomitella gaofuii TaxID=2760083 RepID=UPI0015FCDCC8|nr:TetR/AcrR family transcriptional regulator [Tomitella gaofuii]